jgi:hypothetical protein
MEPNKRRYRPKGSEENVITVWVPVFGLGLGLLQVERRRDFGFRLDCIGRGDVNQRCGMKGFCLFE